MCMEFFGLIIMGISVYVLKELRNKSNMSIVKIRNIQKYNEL